MHSKSTKVQEAMDKINAPELLNESHDITSFDSGDYSINQYLLHKALKNQNRNNARVFVICEPNTKTVIGYYTLSTGSVLREGAPRNIKRNSPDNIPILLLGRMGVSKEWQGVGLGKDLVLNAVDKCKEIIESVAARALIAHALSEEIVVFYEKLGFQKFKNQDLTMCLSLD